MRIYFMLMALMATQIMMAQQKLSCCAHPSEEFAMFSQSDGFASAHADPEPFIYTADEGNWWTFATPDDGEAKGYVIEAKEKSNNWVFVFHEWWGLNDYMRQTAAQLSKDLNVNVMAVDLFDGKTADKKEDAEKLMNNANTDRIEAIIKGAIRIVSEEADIATVGWCFGGGWALQAAIMAGDQAVGCVMYYGMPETDVEKLQQLETDVLGIFAEKDDWINQEVVEEFEEKMEEAGKDLNIITYDADHAFANPSNPQHDKEMTQDAYKQTLNYLKEKF